MLSTPHKRGLLLAGIAFLITGAIVYVSAKPAALSWPSFSLSARIARGTAKRAAEKKPTVKSTTKGATKTAASKPATTSGVACPASYVCSADESCTIEVMACWDVAGNKCLSPECLESTCGPSSCPGSCCRCPAGMIPTTFASCAERGIL